MEWRPSGAVEFRWGDVFECEPDWSWSVRDLPHLDLWYVASGVAWIRSEGVRTELASGDCLLLRRGASYESGHDRAHPLRLIAVHFEFLDARGRRVDPPVRELPPFSRRLESGSLIEALLTRAIADYRADDLAAASAWLQGALLEVLQQDARAGAPGALDDHARQIETMCERIRNHPGDNHRVAELAGELGVSPEHFCRLFRRFQGVSPRAFITQTRLETARTLLLASSHSVARIAALLGYDGPFHFSRQFKDKVGLAPSAFRRRRDGPARA